MIRMEFCTEIMKQFDKNDNFFNWIIKRHLNYMDLSIDKIADIGVTNIHTE